MDLLTSGLPSQRLRNATDRWHDRPAQPVGRWAGIVLLLLLLVSGLGHGHASADEPKPTAEVPALEFGAVPPGQRAAVKPEEASDPMPPPFSQPNRAAEPPPVPALPFQLPPNAPGGLPQRVLQFGVTLNSNEGGTRKSISITNGQRSIKVVTKDETIEIQDKLGKDITLKRTRTVQGKEQIDTFKAPDVETLKKKHPEAGELYKQHAEQDALQLQVQGNVGGLQRQFQFGNGQIQIANGGFRSAEVVPGTSERTVTGRYRGRTCEIFDKFGQSIRVTMTEMKDGQPVPRTVEAESLEELRQKDPDAADAYVRLMGRTP